MPILLKNIECDILDNYVGSINFFGINSDFGTDDYFKVFGMEGLIQNFTKVIDSEVINMNNPYGLRVNKNKDFELLEISY